MHGQRLGVVNAVMEIAMVTVLALLSDVNVPEMRHLAIGEAKQEIKLRV